MGLNQYTYCISIFSFACIGTSTVCQNQMSLYKLIASIVFQYRMGMYQYQYRMSVTLSISISAGILCQYQNSFELVPELYFRSVYQIGLNR